MEELNWPNKYNTDDRILDVLRQSNRPLSAPMISIITQIPVYRVIQKLEVFKSHKIVKAVTAKKSRYYKLREV